MVSSFARLTCIHRIRTKASRIRSLRRLYLIKQSFIPDGNFFLPFRCHCSSRHNALHQIRRSINSVSKRRFSRYDYLDLPAIARPWYPCKPTLLATHGAVAVACRRGYFNLGHLALQYTSYTCHCGMVLKYLMLSARRDTPTDADCTWNVRDSWERKPRNACLADIA